MRKQVSEDLFEVYKTSLANYKNRPIITEQNSILRCLKGDAKLNINSSLYSLEAGENFFLMDTSFFQVDESSEDFQVEVCTFSHSILHDIFAIIHSRVIDTVDRKSVV